MVGDTFFSKNDNDYICDTVFFYYTKIYTSNLPGGGGNQMANNTSFPFSPNMEILMWKNLK